MCATSECKFVAHRNFWGQKVSYKVKAQKPYNVWDTQNMYIYKISVALYYSHNVGSIQAYVSAWHAEIVDTKFHSFQNSFVMWFSNWVFNVSK